MSAETLREAAAQLRAWWSDCDCHEAERAVADWLDRTARRYETLVAALDNKSNLSLLAIESEVLFREALAVARAYLEEAS